MKDRGLWRISAIFIGVLLFAFLLSHPSLAMSFEETDAALREAEGDLSAAFLSVAQAEQAGANVSSLIGKLNDAANFLSEASAALKAGEYNDASSLAIACKNAIEGVADDAVSLKSSAERASNMVLSVIGSIIGLALLIAFGFLGWRFLKKLYYKRALNLKPVGGEDHEY